MSNPNRRAIEIAESSLTGWCQNSHASLMTIIARACELAATEERHACAAIAQNYIDKRLHPSAMWAADVIWEEIMARNGTREVKG